MLKQKSGVTYASSQILDELNFIKYGFLSRLGGISNPPFSSLNFDTRDGDDIKNVEHNKTIIGKLFDFDASRLLTVNQVHGKEIHVIDKPVKDRAAISNISADAIITNQCGIPIGILTADCVPIIIVDPVKKTIGIIHAGWRGTAKHIVQEAVDVMVKHFGSCKDQLLAAIGPSIGQCCYKVDEAVAKHFGNNAFIYKEGDYWRLDLKRANLIQMVNSGISEKNISVEEICTSCRNDLFFSYRVDGKITGRQMNFVMLTQKSS